jgi:hypothetical protein
MASRLECNRRFLENIYRRGPFEGHAFLCNPVYEQTRGSDGRDYTLSDKPVGELCEPIVRNYERKIAFGEEVGDDGVPQVDLTTGTHIWAAALGCRVHTYADNNPCAIPLVRTVEEADALAQPDLWSSPGLARVFEMARTIIGRLGPDTPISPPDVQSGFDIACQVWSKEDLFVAMADERQKEAVKRLTAKCTRLLRDFFDAYRAEFPSFSPCHCPDAWAPPGMGIWLSNDECGSISNRYFEEFCLPELVELSGHFGGLGMHCCARADHQFRSFKKIPGFYAYNHVATQSGYGTLVEHFRDPGDPVHALFYGKGLGDDTVTRLVRNGKPHMRFIFTLDSADADGARAWLERMRSL